ncbi:MAG: type IV pilus assembly protein PilM [Deltaproteobacteria bacterium]|nr:type IV pilus assembly protein PilM [Deltaproteobacteria bacterium]
MLIFDRKNLVGVDIGSYAVKAVKVKGTTVKTLDAIAYSRLDHITLPQDNLRLSEALRNLFNAHRITTKKVAAVLPGNYLTLTHLYLPKMPKKDMKEAVRWEMRKQITFPPEELVCDFTSIGEVKRGEDIMISLIAFGAMKRDVGQVIKIFEDALLEPSTIDATPIAMLASFNHNNVWEDGINYSMMDIGESKSTLAIFKDKRLMFAREIPIAGKELTISVMERLACAEAVAEKEKIRCGIVYSGEGDRAIADALSGVMERLVAEAHRSFDYYQAQFREGAINKMFLCGGTSKLNGIDDFFTSSLGIPCFVDDPLRNIRIEPKRFTLTRLREFGPDLTVAVGLAL